MPTNLTRVISLLYRFQAADVDTLTNQLLDQRKQAWNTALRELATRHGCTQPPRAPSGDDLAELKAQAKADADSIAATWNGDVERQVERLFEANRRGNRNYYAANLERWSAQRETWKSPQVALNSAQTTRFYAQQQFYRLNGIERRYVFVGAAPTCRDCVTRFAAGIVDQNYVDRYPCPRHPNCPHEWQTVNAEQLPCEDLWLG